MTSERPRWRDDGAYVSEVAQLAADVELGPGAVVHAGAVIGSGSRVDAGAVLHTGTVLGAGCLVEDGAVLGKRPRLRGGSRAVGTVGALIVDDDVTICAGAVVYAGVQIDRAAIVGDQAQVRERSRLAERSVVGRGSTIDFEAEIGARVSIQTLVYVTAGTIVEDDVFIGPGVVMTNDNTMGRHGPGAPLRGPVLRRGCRVGGGAVLTPGVVIGEEAFVAAGAVVVADVPERAVVMGVPGRVVRQVDDADLLDRWR